MKGREEGKYHWSLNIWEGWDSELMRDSRRKGEEMFILAEMEGEKQSTSLQYVVEWL